MTNPVDFLKGAHATAEMAAQATLVQLLDHVDGQLAVVGHQQKQADGASLLRITADRKLLELHHDVDGKCEECAQGYELMDWGPNFPCQTIRHIAEGWGWTGPPPKPDWPECMCTPTGECGRCWEKRQEAAAKGEFR